MRMLAKLAVLLHSEIALATPTGVTSHLPLASFAQNGSHHDDDGAHTNGDED